jgi:hypothetical protein
MPWFPPRGDFQRGEGQGEGSTQYSVTPHPVPDFGELSRVACRDHLLPMNHGEKEPLSARCVDTNGHQTGVPIAPSRRGVPADVFSGGCAPTS